LQLLP